jgi:hypothetical protein
MFFVAGRQVVGNEGDVDIGLSDEEGLHKVIRLALMGDPAAPHTSTCYRRRFAKIIREPAALIA